MYIYDSQATDRSGERGGGFSKSVVPLVAWESYKNPSSMVMPVYIATRIRHINDTVQKWD
jgi:hypothetical protein